MEQFEAYFNPRKNITYSRFKFFTHHQEIGQPFDDYMTELGKLSGDCELEVLRELLLIDMLIIGLSDKKLQERLLRESSLDSNKTVEICRIVEVTCSQAHVIQNNNEILENEVLFIDYVSNEDFTPFDNDDNEWTANSEVNKTLISFKIDTQKCSSKYITILSVLNLQNRLKLQPSKFRLSAYNGANIPVKSGGILRIKHSITSIPVLYHGIPVLHRLHPYLA